MRLLLNLEDFAEFLFVVFIFSYLDFAWWWFPAPLLLPDLSMIGYVFNTKVGAVLYNFFHHKGLGIAVGIAGFTSGNQQLMLAGAILFGHSAMDRCFGYGLKYPDSFRSTHLGEIGK